MNRRRWAAVVVLGGGVACGAAMLGAGQPAKEASVNKPEAGTRAPALSPTAPSAAGLARLGTLGFLSGRWRTEGAEYSEEHWSGVHGSSIMGMFRWCNPDGRPAMFEMLTITCEGDDVLLRLRHYSPALVAKEDKDAPMTLKLRTADGGPGGRAEFAAHAGCGSMSGVSYELAGDRLKVEVSFSAESKREALKFDFAREK